jgi:hypothetical protein
MSFKLALAQQTIKHEFEYMIEKFRVVIVVYSSHMMPHIVKENKQAVATKTKGKKQAKVNEEPKDNKNKIVAYTSQQPCHGTRSKKGLL